MEMKVLITTPKGAATKTEKRIRPHIIGNKKLKVDLWVSPEDDQIVWHMEGNVRDIMKANRNVAAFDNIVRMIFSNKTFKKLAVEKKDLEEVENLLKNHTTVEVVKNATQEERDEMQKTWWDRIKEKFKKK